MYYCLINPLSPYPKLIMENNRQTQISHFVAVKTLLATEAHTIFCTKDLRAAIGVMLELPPCQTEGFDQGPLVSLCVMQPYSPYYIARRHSYLHCVRIAVSGGRKGATLDDKWSGHGGAYPRYPESCSWLSRYPGDLGVAERLPVVFDSRLVLLQSVVDRIVPQSIKGRRTKKQVYSRYPAHLPTGLR
jgi:hypothetical protein